MRDLEECIECNRQALELQPSGHPERADSLRNLSMSLMLCEMPDHETVISYLSEARTLLPDVHPRQAFIHRSLAKVYLQQHFLIQPNGESLDVVFDLFKASSTHRTASLTDRLALASEWAAIARKHDHDSCVDAYTTALILLNQISVTKPNLDIQRNSLHSGSRSHYKSLASDAVSSVITAGKIQTAVTLME